MCHPPQVRGEEWTLVGGSPESSFLPRRKKTGVCSFRMSMWTQLSREGTVPGLGALHCVAWGGWVLQKLCLCWGGVCPR